MAEGEETQAGEGAAGAAGTARKRDRTLIEFPYTDLKRAQELTKALADAGGKVWIDQTNLAVAMDMSAAGGTFRGRLSAARMFGLVETEGAKVRISDLGLLVLEEATAKAARAEAFLRVPLYKAMHEAYAGLVLPPAAAVERQMATFGVPPKQTERARQAFASSAQEAGFIASNGRFCKPNVSALPSGEDIDGDRAGGNGNGAGNEVPSGQVPPVGNTPVTEKALEYKLVDLLGEAAGNEEVMSSIIKVVTWLKTRDVAPKTTATDQ
jgi:hypothetical protein